MHMHVQAELIRLPVEITFTQQQSCCSLCGIFHPTLYWWVLLEIIYQTAFIHCLQIHGKYL